MRVSRIAQRSLVIALLALAMVFGLLTPFAPAQGAIGTAGIDFVVEMATITFMLNWDEYDVRSVAYWEYPIGSQITTRPLPDADPPPHRRGFINWTLDQAGNTPFTFPHLVTGDTRLYAQWTLNVEFDPRGGRFLGSIAGGSIDPDDGSLIHYDVHPGDFLSELVPDAPTRDLPHRFMGWFCLDSRHPLSYFTQGDNNRVYTDMTFVAFWSPFVRFVPHDGRFLQDGFTPAPGIMFFPSITNIREIRIEVVLDADDRPSSLAHPEPSDRGWPQWPIQVVNSDNPFPDNDTRLLDWSMRGPYPPPDGDFIDDTFLNERDGRLRLGDNPLYLEDDYFSELEGTEHMMLTVYSRWRRAIPFTPGWPPRWHEYDHIPVELDDGEDRLLEPPPPLPAPPGFESEWWFICGDNTFIEPVCVEERYPEVPPTAVKAVERRRIPLTFSGGVGGTLEDEDGREVPFIRFMPWADGGAEQWPFERLGYRDFLLDDIEYDILPAGQDFAMPQHGSHVDELVREGWVWRVPITARLDQPLSFRGFSSPAAMSSPTAEAEPQTPVYFYYRDFPDRPQDIYAAMANYIDLSFYMNNNLQTEIVALWYGEESTRPDPGPPTPGVTGPPGPPGPPGVPGIPGTRPPIIRDDTTDEYEVEYTEYTEQHEYPEEDDEPSDETAAAPRGRASPPGPPDQRPPPFDTDGTGSWALLNLIMTVICVLGFAIVAVSAIVTRQRRDDDEDEHEEYAADISTQDYQNYEEPEDSTEQEESDPTRRRGIIYVIALGILAALSAVLFILTQNIWLPMVIFDRWTGIHLILLAVAALVLILRYARREPKETEEVESGELKVES